MKSKLCVVYLLCNREESRALKKSSYEKFKNCERKLEKGKPNLQ